MNIAKIVEAWLVQNGYEGLYNDECGCEVGDLMPCDEPNINCEAGYKVPCPGPEECWCDGDGSTHIGGTKAK